MAGISILSGSAGIQTGSFQFAGLDKLAHLLVFGMLAISWVRMIPSAVAGPALRLVLAVLATTLFGLLDELHQLGNPLRTFEWADLLADFLGSVAGSLAYLHLPWCRSLLETEIGDALRLRFPGRAANSAQ